MKTKVNLYILFPTDKKMIYPLILNGVLENVLIFAQYSSKLSHGLCFISQLFRLFGILQFFYLYAQAVLWGL